MTMHLSFIWIWGLLTQQAATDPQPKSRTTDFLEISGLVYDETMSKLGRDFYNDFYVIWQQITETDQSVVVRERPIPGMGTQVRILINDQDVYLAFIRPRAEEIEDAAASAAQECLNYVQNYEQMQEQLSTEDQMGSGIF
ncbi:MAG: CsgE family curli-type amyloid fiber assembly protein [Bacteroidales bacterium]